MFKYTNLSTCYEKKEGPNGEKKSMTATMEDVLSSP